MCSGHAGKGLEKKHYYFFGLGVKAAKAERGETVCQLGACCCNQCFVQRVRRLVLIASCFLVSKSRSFMPKAELHSYRFVCVCMCLGNPQNVGFPIGFSSKPTNRGYPPSCAPTSLDIEMCTTFLSQSLNLSWLCPCSCSVLEETTI